MESVNQKEYSFKNQKQSENVNGFTKLDRQ